MKLGLVSNNEKKDSFRLLSPLLHHARFQFRTIEDIQHLSAFIIQCFPEPQKVELGVWEMMMNAVEHGNLEISYDEKTEYLRNGTLRREIDRRLSMPKYSNRFSLLDLFSREDRIEMRIADGGNSFDWRRYLSPAISDCADAVAQYHGRGIPLSYISFDEISYNEIGNVVTCAVYY